MTKCNCDIWMTECTHKRKRQVCQVCGLAFQSGEKKICLVSMFFWHADCYFICDRISIRKWTVYRRKWLEGHIAASPKSKFSGQSSHTSILLHNLSVTRKHLWTIIWIFQLKLAFVILIWAHKGQNTIISMIGNKNDHSNFAFGSRVKTL